MQAPEDLRPALDLVQSMRDMPFQSLLDGCRSSQSVRNTVIGRKFLV